MALGSSPPLTPLPCLHARDPHSVDDGSGAEYHVLSGLSARARGWHCILAGKLCKCLVKALFVVDL